MKKNRKVGEKHVFENPHYGPFSADQCDQGDGDPISELLRYSVSNMSTIYYTKLPNMAPESTLNDIEFDNQVPNHSVLFLFSGQKLDSFVLKISRLLTQQS